METLSFLPFPLSFFCSYPTYEEWKLWLVQKHPRTIPGRSYPTYEEWKRLYGNYLINSDFGSYPTYEEWKQRYGIGDTNTNFGSYPTYEEWKLMYP